MIVAFEPRHIDYIMSHLSSQTAAEAVAVGLGIDQLRSAFESFVRTGKTETRTILVNDQPGAIFSVSKRNGAAVTFLIAVTGFFEDSIHHLHDLRTFLKEMAGRFGIIYTVTKSPHPNTERWFKALGYRALDISTDTEKVYAWG